MVTVAGLALLIEVPGRRVGMARQTRTQPAEIIENANEKIVIRGEIAEGEVRENGIGIEAMQDAMEDEMTRGPHEETETSLRIEEVEAEGEVTESEMDLELVVVGARRGNEALPLRPRRRNLPPT